MSFIFCCSHTQPTHVMACIFIQANVISFFSIMKPDNITRQFANIPHWIPNKGFPIIKCADIEMGGHIVISMILIMTFSRHHP